MIGNCKETLQIGHSAMPISADRALGFKEKTVPDSAAAAAPVAHGRAPVAPDLT